MCQGVCLAHNAVAAPATVSGEPSTDTPLGILSVPGKVVEDDDPRARRPATSNGHARTRRAGCSGVSVEIRLFHGGCQRAKAGRETAKIAVTGACSPFGASACFLSVSAAAVAVGFPHSVLSWSQHRRLWRWRSSRQAPVLLKRHHKRVRAPKIRSSFLRSLLQRHIRSRTCGPRTPALRRRRPRSRACRRLRRDSLAGIPMTWLDTVATSASRLGLPVLETPASVDVVTQRTMQD